MFLYTLSHVLLYTTVIGGIPNRIIGGVDTTIEKHPHQVLILQDGQFICGGSIISQFYVLTAAHCVYERGHQYLIKSGTNNRTHGKTHELSEIITHENFDYYELDCDIALLKVIRPFQFDETRQPIELFNNAEEITPSITAVVTGWGKNNSSYKPEILQEVSVPIISNNFCQEVYSEVGQKIKPGEICAGLVGLNFCAGDTGGPLTVDGRLAGIASWGHERRYCVDNYYPGVYTKVAYYRDWINKRAKINN